MASERALPEGWLNDAAKAFLPGPDPDLRTVFERPGLGVAVASPRILLALKVLAHRSGEDENDVRLLARELGLGTAHDVVDVAEAVIGERLAPAAQFFVEEIFGGT
jgi:hypothetical protein